MYASWNMYPSDGFTSVGLKYAGAAWRFGDEREAALLQTLKELYEEGVPPIGGLVRKRMWRVTGIKVTMKELHRLSLQMQGQVVIHADQPDENNKQDLGNCWFCLYGDGSLPSLIDIQSADDPYVRHDPFFWESFTQEINRLSLEQVLQAGPHRGIWAIADLLRCHMPMLRNKRLGEVIHIVKLSLKRRILGFRGHHLGKYDEAQGYTGTQATRRDCREQFVGYPVRAVVASICPVTVACPYVRTMAELKDIVNFLLMDDSRKTYLRSLKRLIRLHFSKDRVSAAASAITLNHSLNHTPYENCPVQCGIALYYQFPSVFSKETTADLQWLLQKGS